MRRTGLILSACAYLIILAGGCGDDDYQPEVENTALLCSDGVDNDGDGLTDCEDTDCSSFSVCKELICDDGVDDEGDGLIDCQDPDCQSTATCAENTSTRCQNNIDDDGDGDTDCEDSDCQGFAFCVPTETDCQNGIDDDGDGDTDCDDSDCSPLAVCGGFCYTLDFTRPGTFGMAVTEANDDNDPNTDCVQYDVMVEAINPEPSTQVCLYLDQATTPVACADPNVTNPVTFSDVDLCQGNHSLFARVEQGANQCQPERQDVIVYENPSCTITLPANLSTDSGNPTLTNSTTETFAVTTSGARAELYINGAMRPSQSADTNGVATFTDAPLGADGSVEVHAICYNPGSGNGETTSVSYYLDKDSQAPVVTINSPADDTTFGVNECPIDVTVTVEGGSVGEDVCANMQGVAPGTNGCGTITNATSEQFNLEVPCNPNGTGLTLEASTTDTHGNTGTDTATVNIDTGLPSVIIEGPVNGTTYNKADDTIDAGTNAFEFNITACTDGDYNPGNIDLEVDGIAVTSLTPTVTAASCGGLGYRITWSAPYAFSQNSSGLSTAHTVQVTVSDGVNQSSAQVAFNNDTMAPVIDLNCVGCLPDKVFISSSDDECAGQPVTTRVIAQVAGLEVGRAITLAVSHGGSPVGSSPYSVNSTSSSLTFPDFSAPCGVELAAGQNQLQATAIDAAGNAAVPRTRILTQGDSYVVSPLDGAVLSVGDSCGSGGNYGIEVTVEVASNTPDNTEVEVYAASAAGGWSYPSPSSDIWYTDCSSQGASCQHVFCILVPDTDVEQTDIALTLSQSNVTVPGGPTNITVDISSPPSPTNLGLTVVSRRAAELELSWNDVEDAQTGILTAWDVRCLPDGTLTEGNWASAMEFSGEPTPSTTGTAQTMRISQSTGGVKLRAGHSYSCGIRGVNSVGLWSPLVLFDAVSESDVGLIESGTTIEGYSLRTSTWRFPSVEPAGDLNGDGYDDLLVGWGEDGEGSAAAVFFGSASGVSSTPSVTLQCADSSFGGKLVGIGDFDGEVYDSSSDPYKYPDFAVSSPDQGVVYIFRGHSGLGGTLNCANADFVIQGSPSIYFGTVMAGIGDFDADTKADIAIGAAGYNTYGGAVWVIFGRSSTTYPQLVNLSSGAKADGALLYEGAAFSATGNGLVGGDFDKDGYSDLVIAATWGGAAEAEGQLYVLKGYDADKTANTVVPVYETDLEQTITFTYPGTIIPLFGTPSVTPIDIDGDGCLDLAVGAPRTNIGSTYSASGNVFFYLGQTSGAACTGTFGGSYNHYLSGGATWEQLGRTVANVTNMTVQPPERWRFNGVLTSSSDTVLLTGAREYKALPAGSEAETGPGFVTLHYAPFTSNMLKADADLVLTGPSGSVGFSWVNLVGDLNGDGYVDIAVGDVNYGTGGRIVLYY